MIFTAKFEQRNFSMPFHLFARFLTFSFIISLVACTDLLPVEERTYIYLVSRGAETTIETIIIEEDGDGFGFMDAPDILGNFDSTFNLTIDRIDENRANFNAVQREPGLSTQIRGAGFYTPDSIYSEFSYSLTGFDQTVVFRGTR